MQPPFCRSDSANVNVRLEIKGLLEELRIFKFVFDLRVGDWAVDTPETAFIASKT